MDNMIKNIWTPPTNNKKESRKLTKYKNKKYEPLAKSDKIIIPIISFSVWRLAIKFTIEFKR